MIDNVHHPRHYERGRVECIKLTELYDSCLGNAIKYVWRHMDKGHPVEDLAKAKWYVERESKRLNSTVCEPAQWMSRRYRLLRKLEQCNHADAHDFWAHLRVGSLAHMATDIETMMLRAQEGEREHHQA
mgnify:CR=1 FL=1